MRGSPSRILLKLSGEAFQGPEGPLSSSSIERILGEIPGPKEAQIALVVGGGNVLRGGRAIGFDRIEADTLGMMATLLNAVALRSHVERSGREALVQSAVFTELTDPISPEKAKAALERGAVVIFAGGTGSPLVTTDTAAALRAVSIGASLLAKASNVSGVYDGDPAKQSAAKLLSEVSYDDFLEERYGVMDRIAVEICREHSVPIEVFDFARAGALRALAAGERVGTRIG
jgi:uridylate kinase